MRNTFFKKPLLALLTLILALTISSCGGGGSSFDDLIDEVTDNSDLPGWELNGLRFFASEASRNSLGAFDLLTTTSVGLDNANEIVTSIVTMQYRDTGPGDYTLVSSLDQLFSEQARDPQGKFLLIAATILNSANNSTVYQSDDLGIVNVTNNALNDLVFNIPSPVSLIRSSGDLFPVTILFKLFEIFEDLPAPSLP